MRLYNIQPRESVFNWPDKSGKNRKVEITGQWIGQDPNSVFIPIFTGPSQPIEDNWMLMPSETGRPKIVSNAIQGCPGTIALLTSYDEPGHAVGSVSVHEEDLDNITVIASGTRESDEEALRYHEHLVEIRTLSRFLVQTTQARSYILRMDEFGEQISPLGFGVDAAAFISLNDQAVMTWRKLRRKQANV